jgi:hypothetical protein
MANNTSIPAAPSTTTTVTGTGAAQQESWPLWFRTNSDKLLLFFSFVGLLFFVTYLVKHAMDASLVSWAREITWAVLSAFLTMVTGGAAALLRGGHATTSTTTTAGPSQVQQTPDSVQIAPAAEPGPQPQGE